MLAIDFSHKIISKESFFGETIFEKISPKSAQMAVFLEHPVFFRNELLKEYVQLYEKAVGYKWSRDILAIIAQIGPNHPYYNKAPEDKDQLLDQEPLEVLKEGA